MGRKPVIFLDRDGVICKEKSYVTAMKDLEILSFAKQATRNLKQLGYLLVVITNQSAVARGLMDESELLRMHAYLQKELDLNAIYYCPHYPPIDGESEVKPYQLRCECRKPGTGLLKQAVADYSLDLEDAWFVGDRASDILAGQAMNINTVLVESGYGTERLEMPIIPNYTFRNLLEFSEFMKERCEKREINAISKI